MAPSIERLLQQRPGGALQRVESTAVAQCPTGRESVGGGRGGGGVGAPGGLPPHAAAAGEGARVLHPQGAPTAQCHRRRGWRHVASAAHTEEGGCHRVT